MPRAPRRNVPGFVYHLISRFVDRDWFITCEEERSRYVTLLGSALSDSDWRCLGFAVMSNHIHLAVVAGTQPLDAWLRRVHSPFADWMNQRHDRIGSMFVRGPKDFAIARHRIRDLLAYVHNNPVRAGVVGKAADSTWTSHRAYVGLVVAPRWLHVDEGLSRSGFQDGHAFGRWVSGASAGARQGPPSEPEMQHGSAIPARTGLRCRGPSPRAIVEATAEELGIPLTQLRSTRRGALESLGREVAIQCAARLGLRGVEIASALDISQQGESVIRRRSSSSTEVGERCARVLRRLTSSESSV